MMMRLLVTAENQRNHQRVDICRRAATQTRHVIREGNLSEREVTTGVLEGLFHQGGERNAPILKIVGQTPRTSEEIGEGRFSRHVLGREELVVGEGANGICSGAERSHVLANSDGEFFLAAVAEKKRAESREETVTESGRLREEVGTKIFDDFVVEKMVLWLLLVGPTRRR